MTKVEIPEPGEVRKELAATVRRADVLRRLLRLSEKAAQDQQFIESLDPQDAQSAGCGR